MNVLDDTEDDHDMSQWPSGDDVPSRPQSSAYFGKNFEQKARYAGTTSGESARPRTVCWPISRSSSCARGSDADSALPLALRNA